MITSKMNHKRGHTDTISYPAMEGPGRLTTKSGTKEKNTSRTTEGQTTDKKLQSQLSKVNSFKLEPS